MISNKINDEHLKTFSLSLNKYLRARTLAGWLAGNRRFFAHAHLPLLSATFFLRFGTSQLTPGDPRGACELRVRGQQPAERESAPAVWEVPPRPTPSQQNKSPRSLARSLIPRRAPPRQAPLSATEFTRLSVQPFKCIKCH